MTIELPCKIGDVVWINRRYQKIPRPLCGIVGGMYFMDDMSLCIVVSHLARGIWGEDVFPTKEAALKAIERSKTHENKKQIPQSKNHP